MWLRFYRRQFWQSERLSWLATALGAGVINVVFLLLLRLIYVDTELYRFKEHFYAELVWPTPYIPAVLLLLAGLALWCRQAELDRLETGLLQLPVCLAAASLIPYLRLASWWLVGLASLVVVTALIRQINFSNLLQLWPSASTQTTFGRFIRLIPLTMAGLAFSLFMVITPSFSFDTNLFLSWTAKIHSYGPVDIYLKVPELDYPPLIVYLLWLYGWIMSPFGLLTSLPAFKITFALCLLGLVWLTQLWSPWRQFRPGLGGSQVLITFSAALVFNPMVWGQVDALLGLMMICTLLAISGRNVWFAGGWLNLILIFKPQAWFVLPLFGLLLFYRHGWWRGLAGFLAGSALSFGLCVIAFGGQISVFLKFWSQPALAGEAKASTFEAFNFFWLLGFHKKAAPLEVALLGFALIGCIYLIILFFSLRRPVQPAEIALATTLVLLVFFMFSIKMHERYLYYCLPSLALACIYQRRLYKPFLLLNLVCLVNPLYSYLKFQGLIKGEATWPVLLHPVLFSWLTLATGIYLFGFYLKMVLPELHFSQLLWPRPREVDQLKL